MYRPLPLLLAVLLIASPAAWSAPGMAVQGADLDLLVTWRDFFDPENGYDPAADETCSEEGSLGTITLDCRYETPEGEPYLFIYSSVSRELSASDARDYAVAGSHAMLKGFRKDGITAEPRDLWYRAGPNSASWLLLKDGKPIGEYFYAQLGYTHVQYLTYGTWFDDALAWQRFIGPKLDLQACYTPLERLKPSAFSAEERAVHKCNRKRLP